MTANRTDVIKDSDGIAISVAPKGIKTIIKDVEIPYKAIQCNTDLVIYFGTETGTTYSWVGGVPLPVHPDMRLVTSTECLVY